MKRPKGLSSRDLKVLRLKALGKSHAQIADELYLSRKTVEGMLGANDDRKSIPLKLGRENSEQAVSWYVSSYGDPNVELAAVEQPVGGHTNLTLTALELLQRGARVAQHDWFGAIPIFRQAESLFGTSSSNAVRAAIWTVEMLVNLGDYSAAGEEIRRIEASYRHEVMDPETKALWYRINGWLDYLLSNYSRSEQWFQKLLHIAKEYKDERLTETAHHILGRMFLLQGQRSGNPRLSAGKCQQAREAISRAIQINANSSSDLNVAFNLVAESQILLAQGQWYDAQRIRYRARRLFGDDLARVHIDLEESRIALARGEEHEAALKAERALKLWAQSNYAEGMANALNILANRDLQRGETAQALEAYLASYCIYPYRLHASDQFLGKNIRSMATDLAHVESRKQYNLYVDHLEADIMQGNGYFAYLRAFRLQRENTIEHLIKQLRTLVEQG